MPDDYAGSGGGALRLKGAKVTKKKKKRDKTLEKKAASVATVEKPEDNDEDDAGPADRKTEAERRHEETRKKRMLQMAKESGGRPELLKTHKERVEELNTYLSKLSEHHDMPKIGPG